MKHTRGVRGGGRGRREGKRRLCIRTNACACADLGRIGRAGRLGRSSKRKVTDRGKADISIVFGASMEGYSDVRVEKGKRKRMKKTRDGEEWTPNPPPPPLRSMMRGDSVSLMNEVPRADGMEPAGGGDMSSSVFEEPPPPIQSFAEVERSKQRTKNGVHGSRAQGSVHAPTSVLQFFHGGGGEQRALLALSGQASLKRKRRTEKETRSSRRQRDEGNGSEIDMVRFGVDPIKLVPQGLVDRIDARLSRSLIDQVIGSHVQNWIRRAAFGTNFLLEMSTLLAAYYPCTHPTLLDEVLVGFVFKRPELLDTLLQPIIDKMLKTGDSASSIRYPFIEAFVRKCASTQVICTRERKRHRFACMTMLRYLVERNPERFTLSPWIIVCANACDSEVQADFVCALLDSCVRFSGPRVSRCDVDCTNWEVFDPMEHVFELVREEESAQRQSIRGDRSLSEVIVEFVLSCEEYKSLRESLFFQKSVELFVSTQSPDGTHALLRKCLPIRTDEEWSNRLLEILSPFASVLTRQSVSHPYWFPDHILTYLNNSTNGSNSNKAIKALFHHFTPCFLGGLRPDDVGHTVKMTINRNELKQQKAHYLESSSSYPVLSGEEISARIIHILEIQRNSYSPSTSIRAWKSMWLSQESWQLCPGRYLMGFIRTVSVNNIEERIGHPSAVKMTNLTASLVSKFLERSLESSHEEGFLVVVRESFGSLLPSSSAWAIKLLKEVTSAFSTLTSKLAFANKQNVALGNALLYCFAEFLSGALGSNGFIRNQSPSRESQLPAVIQPRNFRELQVIGNLRAMLLKHDQSSAFIARIFGSPRGRKIIEYSLRGTSTARALAMIDMLCSLLEYTTENDTKLSWFDISLVKRVLDFVYSDSMKCSRSAIKLLDMYSRRSSNPDHQTQLLWTLVNECSKTCCGCRMGLAGKGYIRDASTDICQIIRRLLYQMNRDDVDLVLEHVEQHAASCTVEGETTNLFVLLLLRQLCTAQIIQTSTHRLISVVHVALAGVSEGSNPVVVVLKLELLRAFCACVVDVGSDFGQIPPDQSEVLLSVLLNDDVQAQLHALSGRFAEVSTPATASLAAVVLEYVEMLHLRVQ